MEYSMSGMSNGCTQERSVQCFIIQRHVTGLHSLFTLRKPRSPLILSGERGFRRVNKLYALTACGNPWRRPTRRRRQGLDLSVYNAFAGNSALRNRRNNTESFNLCHRAGHIRTAQTRTIACSVYENLDLH